MTRRENRPGAVTYGQHVDTKGQPGDAANSPTQFEPGEKSELVEHQTGRRNTRAQPEQEVPSVTEDRWK